MTYQLSPQSEQFLASVVAGGQYASKEAALEAAIAALREKSELSRQVPEEHMELVEEAIVSAHDGRLREMSPEDWSRLRQLARDAAARGASGGP